MKKILSAVAALGLVAGVATVASAADLSVTGKYLVEGVYINHAGATGGALPADLPSDAYWMHTFQMLPNLAVNDKVTLKSDVRLRKEARFGVAAEDAGNGAAVDFNKIYMDYASPVGKIRVGRTPAGAWGTPFLNSATAASRIMWWPKMEGPVSVLLFTQKSTEADSQAGNDDQDKDLYHAGLSYKTDGMKVDAGLFYTRNGAVLNADGDVATDIVIQVAGSAKISSVSLAGEFAMVTGDKNATAEWDAMGALLMASSQFNNLSATAAFVYATGDDAATADDEGLMNKFGSLGKDFQPLYIFTGDTAGILNHDEKSGNTTAALAGDGVICVALLADYKLSDSMTVHGGFAYGLAEETTMADDDYGMEFDLGLAYKMYDNMTYSAHFGYVLAGDYFGAGAEDIMLVSHSLTMKF